MSNWLHVQRDAYPAYISWEQYLANQERLHQNATNYAHAHAHGVPREGAALFQGLMRCGHCGHVMHIDYKPTPVYYCESRYKHTGEPRCLRVVNQAVETVVLQTFFEAI